MSPTPFCKPTCALVLALPALSLLGGEARAADETTDTTLPQITVTGSRAGASQTLGATTVEPATLDRLRDASSDTASLLRNVPGVSLYGAGGLSSLPVIHGLADDRLRIKVDGMDLIAACPNHMNPALSYLDPSQVDVLRVYAGITPVSVGGDAIGGTIIAETPAPEFAAPGQKSFVKGQLGAFYRSNADQSGGNVAVTWANDRLNVSYSGATARSDNYKAGGDFKDYDVTGVPGHTLPRDEVGSTAYKTRNHLLGVALRGDNHLVEAKLGYQDLPYQLYPNQRMDMLDNTQHRINLRYLGQFGWGALEARAYHEKVDHYMDFGDDKMFVYGAPPGIVAPGMPMYTRSKNTGATIKATVDLSARDVLRLGSEIQNYRLNDWWPPSPAVLPAGTSFGGMAPDTFWNINDGQRNRTALFTEWESRVSPQWLTLVGVRYERVKMDAGPVQGYNRAMAGYWASADAFNAANREKTDNNWDLTALARYSPDTMHDIEFGYAMKTRSPNLYERYSWSKHSMALEMNNFVGDGNGYFGDPNLKPETAHTISATFDWHAPDREWEFKATPYYTHVTDFIDAVRCQGSGAAMNALCGGPANTAATNQFVHLQYANQAARLYGLDLSGKMPLARNRAGKFGLNGLINITRGKNLDTGDGLYNIMPLNARLALTHQYRGWDNGIELLMVKGKSHVSDVRNEIKTPGFSLVNLRTSYTWKQVHVNFGVENLFDKLYYLPLGGAYTGQGATMSFNREIGGSSMWGTAVPGMGRSIYVGVTMEF
ncbi:TonB-dependent receptor [Ramlibacter sp. H39-3-26]|uniref:TonB-dependent receptor n=1 Tax=Curvibacter soli TaxID=3031331 RepID=UPI0023DA856D|nr:TonB-dependent receptor [Ramlibacter sp. H39-3-26]MDF1485737.1 TonB-dependent receptor [Ramlibacter sp. H39-3-26]